HHNGPPTPERFSTRKCEPLERSHLPTCFVQELYKFRIEALPVLRGHALQGVPPLLPDRRSHLDLGHFKPGVSQNLDILVIGIDEHLLQIAATLGGRWLDRIPDRRGKRIPLSLTHPVAVECDTQ